MSGGVHDSPRHPQCGTASIPHVSPSALRSVVENQKHRFGVLARKFGPSEAQTRGKLARMKLLMPVSAGEPLMTVSMVLISLRWCVA